MESHRRSPLVEFCDIGVSKRKDFSENGLLDEDMPIAKENFIIIFLANGFKIAIRPSGTEPKVKFYIFGERPLILKILRKQKKKCCLR